jgi:hypothetical protein
MVLPYGVGMPASKRPLPQDAATARGILIAGLGRDADIFGIVSGLAPLHPRNDTFPGEVFLRWAPTQWTGVGPAGPIRWPWRG